MSNPTLIPKPSSPLHKLFKPPEGKYFEDDTYKGKQILIHQEELIEKQSLDDTKHNDNNNNLNFEMIELEERIPIETINHYEGNDHASVHMESTNDDRYITPLKPNKKRMKPAIKRKVIIEYIDAPEDESFYEVESDQDDEEYNPNKPKPKNNRRKKATKDISFIDADIIDPTKIDPEELKKVPREVRSLIGPVQKLKSYSAEKPQAPSVIMEKVKKTKSGRLIVPPLDYWRGQYKKTDAFGNMIEITEGTPSVRPSNRKRHSLDSNVSSKKRKFIKNTEGKELNFDDIDDENFYGSYATDYNQDIPDSIMNESNLNNEIMNIDHVNINYEKKESNKQQNIDNFYEELDSLIEEEEKELLQQHRDENIFQQQMHFKEKQIHDDVHSLHRHEEESLQQKDLIFQLSSHKQNIHKENQIEQQSIRQKDQEKKKEEYPQIEHPHHISSHPKDIELLIEEEEDFLQPTIQPNDSLQLKKDSVIRQHSSYQEESDLLNKQDNLETKKNENVQQIQSPPQKVSKNTTQKKDIKPELNRIEPIKIEQTTKTSIESNGDDSQDDIEVDNWDEEQLECLRKAITKYDPDDPKYWFKVSKHVPRKSAVECVQKYLGDLNKTKETSKTKKTKAKKMMSPLSIGDDMRLLKNRKKLRDLRKQKEENHQTDIFDSPSFSSKYESTLKMINEYESDDEDLYTKKIIEATRDINEMVTPKKKEDKINNDNDSIEESSEESDYEYFLDAKNVDRDKYDKYLNRIKAPLKKPTKDIKKKNTQKKVKSDSSITQAIKIIRKLENQNVDKDLDSDDEENEESEETL